jgi:secondary thiamine-phosphate synthase enzyme
MIQQVAFKLKPQSRGFHLITDEVLRNLPKLPKTGLLNLFVQHTSCALSICENWDPSVREDLETIYDRLIPENAPYYQHTLEGSDDMPAHAKCIITGVSINIPITDGRLNLGTWQGIYLCEFRNDGGSRHIVATILE